jgi:hypothetical protein
VIGADLTFIKELLLELDGQTCDLATDMDPVGALTNGLSTLQATLETKGSQLDDVTALIGGLIS